MLVDGTLGHDDDVQPRAAHAGLGGGRWGGSRQGWGWGRGTCQSPSYLCQPPAQVIFPVIIGGGLRNEDPVGTAGQGSDERQVAGVGKKEAVQGFFLTFFIGSRIWVVAQGRTRSGDPSLPARRSAGGCGRQEFHPTASPSGARTPGCPLVWGSGGVPVTSGPWW